ncbi:TonB-dependent receptor [Belliella sp. DSM 111904]|uniref:TonB-dependent receptor n=1 Tax=Belliella filtrata TaxID=2923435 RepID=A0ABS9UXV6_9BACT|nr:TonB-dependent receptor [Belliella filtrata]MCH7408780.1 TonB-dependent receptor [Belliella filtrata]
MTRFIQLLILSATFFSFVTATAQDFEVKGKVIEAESSNPLEFANIALLNPGDSALVTGGMSELDGTFSFQAVSGEYILRVGFIGYESRFRNITLGEKEVLNVGNVRLRKDAQNLDEVVVEGVTSMFESDIDKRRYNVENSILAEGAMASDLLSTLPSIQMDDEGGISMRGSGNILIYINGRPSNLSGDDAESVLAQFPANSIKSVELITNPSSRYDAAGVGGIINIILKKNERTGLNGQVNAGIGTRGKYNAGLNINYGTEKANYYASYNWQDNRRFRESESFRQSNLSTASPILDQDAYQVNRDINHLIRGGVDWSITENKLFGVYVQGSFRDRTGDELLNQRNLTLARDLDSLFVRDIREERSSENFEAGITYSVDIDTLGQRFFTTATYSRDERLQNDIFDQLFFNEFNQEVPSNRILQLNDRPQTSDLYMLQMDYEKPFVNGGKLEGGLKGTFREWNRSQFFSEGNEGNGFEPELNDFFSDSFNFKEDVYASYLSYRNKIGKIGYQGGLRAEYTETISRLASAADPYINNYFNLFPSAYLSYELGQEEEFTANFSRRINRPGMWSLAPIFGVSDLYNLSIGNPELQPEFTNSYELGYMKGWERYLLNATVYHRFSTDIHTRIIRLNEDNVAIQTRENANSRVNTGLELVNQFQLTSWFDATVSGNFFYSEIRGDNIEAGFNNSNYSWTVNTLFNMVIPKVASVQIQGDYRGPIVLPQGEIEPMWGVNVGVRRDLLDKKATISLNVSDIFNTRIFRISTNDERFIQDRWFNRETRIGTLSFTYRFGGFKDKSRDRERSRDDFDDDDF